MKVSFEEHKKIISKYKRGLSQSNDFWIFTFQQCMRKPLLLFRLLLTYTLHRSGIDFRHLILAKVGRLRLILLANLYSLLRPFDVARM